MEPARTTQCECGGPRRQSAAFRFTLDGAGGLVDDNQPSKKLAVSGWPAA
jgi:hypothetical protein